MFFTKILAGVVSVGSLVAAAPSLARDATPVERGLKYRTKAQRRNPLRIEQTVVEQSVTIVENQNLGALNQLAQIAETEFAALVQSQVALATQLDDIKNNIRVNHFKARFSQVNTVIVTVTNVVDARDSANINKRYLINQLVADNGFPEKQLLVMVSQAQELTILATPTLDISGIVGGVASISAVSSPTAAPAVAPFNPAAPFGQVNGSLILPYNTSAPANAIVLADPADIIFPNSAAGLFVESAAGFQQDCGAFVAQANSFIDLANAQLFASAEAAAAAQLAGLQLGTITPVIPSNVLTGNPALAQAAQAAIASQQAQAGAQSVQVVGAASVSVSQSSSHGM